MKPSDQLTPHFQVWEFFVRNGKFNQPLWDYFTTRPPDEKAFLEANLMALAKELEHLRVAFGSSIHISSGFRSPAVNRAVGGATKSAHLECKAVDVFQTKVSNAAFWKWADARWLGRMEKLRYTPTWTHLDTRLWGEKLRVGL